MRTSVIRSMAQAPDLGSSIAVVSDVCEFARECIDIHSALMQSFRL